MADTLACLTPFEDLDALLARLRDEVTAALGNQLIGIYLQGSLAIGDFDEHSDVDFIVILRHDLDEDRVRPLQRLHKSLFDAPGRWARRLEGSYLPIQALQAPPPPTRPYWFLDHGSSQLVRSDHDDSLVVHWVLHEAGLTLCGPPIRTLTSPVPAEALKREVRETVKDWGADLLAQPVRLANRHYQPFVVLSYCRMLHTLATGAIDSKRAGAQWALQALPSEWSDLIQGASCERAEPLLRVQQAARPEDIERTCAFIRFAQARIEAAQYRIAVEADLAQLADLRWRLQTSDAPLVDAAAKHRFVSDFVALHETEWKPGEVYHWVAETDDGVVAAMSVVIVRKVPKPGALRARWGYLTNCYALPQVRNRGVGGGLLAAIKAWAAEEDLELLVVWPSDQAVPFYERAGFDRPWDPLVLKIA